jgi:hypothetical protein
VGGQYVEYNKNQEVPMNKTEMAMKLAKKTGISQGKAADRPTRARASSPPRWMRERR